jgi:hypothetical protein
MRAIRPNGKPTTALHSTYTNTLWLQAKSADGCQLHVHVEAMGNKELTFRQTLSRSFRRAVSSATPSLSRVHPSGRRPEYVVERIAQYLHEVDGTISVFGRGDRLGPHESELDSVYVLWQSSWRTRPSLHPDDVRNDRGLFVVLHRTHHRYDATGHRVSPAHRMDAQS